MSDERVTKSIQIPIFKVDEMKRIVYGKALVPDKEDSQGDIISKEDIEAAAHEFMANMQLAPMELFKSVDTMMSGITTNMTEQQMKDMMEQMNQKMSKVGFQHQVFKDIGYFVESYIDSEGSWVLGTKVTNDQVWEGIMKGEITGYSIGGVGTRIPIEQ